MTDETSRTGMGTGAGPVVTWINLDSKARGLVRIDTLERGAMFVTYAPRSTG